MHLRSATARAHPNVALVKYWGKRPGELNIPAGPSLSITLDGLSTRTMVAFDSALAQDRIVLNGRPADDERVVRCLDRLRARARVPRLFAEVSTTNDFPTGAGLASSASGFAALVTAAEAALELGLSPAERSVEARIASASAARSVFGGFVTLAGNGLDSDSWTAAPLAVSLDWLVVVVAICETAPKSISSSEGMLRSALTSPFYSRWLQETELDFVFARTAVAARDFERLARIAEASCLKMHAVMLTSSPALIYWNAATLHCMHAIRQLRERGMPVFFTVDAGPQVKAVCLPGSAREVAERLAAIPGVQETLTVGLGRGAELEA